VVQRDGSRETYGVDDGDFPRGFWGRRTGYQGGLRIAHGRISHCLDWPALAPAKRNPRLDSLSGARRMNYNWIQFDARFTPSGSRVNHRQIGAGRLVGLTAPFLLIPQRADGNVIPRGKFLLRGRERPAQGFDACHTPRRQIASSPPLAV